MARFDDLADIPAIALATLSPGHAPAIRDHLLRLSADDRSLRFCAGTVSDATIDKYVASIRFGEDCALGVLDDDERVIAFAHACWFDSRDGRQGEASFSVEAALRNRGIGQRLLRAVRTMAEDADAVALIGQCLARNRPMRRVFESAGMTLCLEDGEVHAHGWTTTMPACPLPSPVPASLSTST